MNDSVWLNLKHELTQYYFDNASSCQGVSLDEGDAALAHNNVLEAGRS